MPHCPALAIVWYVPVNLASENFLFDSITALSLMIAFYYALTGIACIVYYRRELTKSVRNFLFIGVGPLVGALILGYLFVKSSIDFADPENSYTGQDVLGLGVPFVIGTGFLLLGLVLLVLWRLGENERFFGRKAFEAVDPATYFAGFPKDQVSPISCPDNVTFDAYGNLWISTDGNQLGSHDGLFGVATSGSREGELKQFLTMPTGAETCGPVVQEERVLVSVQHPGEVDGATVEKPASTWPDGPGTYPRPAVVSVWRS